MISFEDWFSQVYLILKQQSPEQQAYYSLHLEEIVEYANIWYDVDESAGNAAIKIIYKFEKK